MKWELGKIYMHCGSDCRGTRNRILREGRRNKEIAKLCWMQKKKEDIFIPVFGIKLIYNFIMFNEK